MNAHCYAILVILIYFISPFRGLSQNIRLEGTIYDHFTKRPLPAVSVMASGGKGVISDSLGRYSLTVSAKDSIWFSYLFKETVKYPIDTIPDKEHFDIALYVDAVWLPEVKVRNKNYYLDSLQNRKDYAKIFNFKKPTISFSTPNVSSYVPGSLTAGIDLNEFINIFRVKRNRQILNMQKRLYWEEEEKYIDHRFNKSFVRRITGLEMPALDSFMSVYRPSYQMLQEWNDIELASYIDKCYQNFLYHKQRGELEKLF